MLAATSFSAFSPAYENIANRMSRLKHHKSTQSLSQIRPNSARKVQLNVFAVDPCESSGYQPRRRLSPAHIMLDNEPLASTGDKFTGRVAKNTGIKKYNQRQLREFTDAKNTPVHLSTELTYRKSPHSPFAIQNLTPFNLIKAIDEVKTKEQPEKAIKKGVNSLIPGRIYTRQALKTVLQ